MQSCEASTNTEDSAGSSQSSGWNVDAPAFASLVQAEIVLSEPCMETKRGSLAFFSPRICGFLKLAFSTVVRVSTVRDKGVIRVVILDGRVQNACLLELFTEHGVGTLIRD